MLNGDLLSALDKILRTGEYNEAGNTVFQFTIPDEAPRVNTVTMTWDQRRGLQHASGETPTCAAEFDSGQTFHELVTREKQILDLLGRRQIRLGGLFDDAAAFARLFQTTTQIPKEHRLITLSPAKKREAQAEALEKFHSLDLDALETERIEKTLVNFVQHRIDKCILDAVIEMDVPGLPVRPWLDAEDLGLSQIFENSFSDLRNEAMGLISGEIVAPQYGGRLDAPDQTAPGRPFG